VARTTEFSRPNQGGANELQQLVGFQVAHDVHEVHVAGVGGDRFLNWYSNIVLFCRVQASLFDKFIDDLVHGYPDVLHFSSLLCVTFVTHNRVSQSLYDCVS
jgi:hypothetical protein